MSENQNFRDYGQQFKTELDQALQTGNFNGLNELVQDVVKNSVNGAIDQGMKAAGSAFDMAQSALNTAGNEAADAVSRTFATRRKEQPAMVHREFRQMRSAGTQKAQLLPPLFKKVGSASGTILQIFGWIGIGAFGITLLVLGIITLAAHATGLIGVDIFFLLLAAGSAAMVAKGGSLKARLARAERYFKLCQRTGYCNVSDLAREVGRDDRFVVKELKTLLEKGAYSQGHLDREEQCFMITDAAYKEYERVTSERQQIALNQQEKEEQARRRELEEANLTEQERMVRSMIREGEEYIALIRQKNDAIPGEVFSQKLYRMEALLKEIFVNVEKRPEQASKMHRLMNYYLPTTLKLLTAYEEFDRMSVQGEDVTDAKREIENTIDTINDAFGELLNKLFAATAMDVTTDAQVLKTMLAQEGLTKEGIMKEENENVYGFR
ncbi:MAG: 5-bromo-4-chloroindolyl phosphate hydrolysis family protein [Lachnospiraceae bacterium]|nr:5-bromo-4-chloroindolyl phosphate hydrolysis family protein [Lachnospiraceae bacterium]